MNADEVKQAVEKGKIPLNVFDKILLTFSGFVLLFSIGMFIESIIKFGFEPFMIFFEFSILFIMALLAYQHFFEIRKLIPYLSNIPFDRKTNILNSILNEYGAEYDEREENIFEFLDSGNGTWSGNYSITIIYNDSGYYINCTKSFGKGRILSKDKTKEVIEKIKKLEARLI